MSHEFRRLRTGLTAAAAAVCALILAFLTAVILIIFTSYVTSQEKSNFEIHVSTICQTLQQSIVSHSVLRRLEAQYGVIVRIYERGKPLFFQQLNETAETSAFLSDAEREAEKRYDFSFSQEGHGKTLVRHDEFSFESGGEHFLAAAAFIPGNETSLNALILFSTEKSRRRTVAAALIFIMADCIALFMLMLFFRSLISRLITPLEESKRRQTEFIAAASHELRTPLAVIMSGIEAAANGSIPADCSFFQTLLSETKRMSHLTDDLLKLAGADAGRMELNISEVEPDTLLLTVYESYEA